MISYTKIVQQKKEIKMDLNIVFLHNAAVWQKNSGLIESSGIRVPLKMDRNDNSHWFKQQKIGGCCSARFFFLAFKTLYFLFQIHEFKRNDETLQLMLLPRVRCSKSTLNCSGYFRIETSSPN